MRPTPRVGRLRVRAGSVRPGRRLRWRRSRARRPILDRRRLRSGSSGRASVRASGGVRDLRALIRDLVLDGVDVFEVHPMEGSRPDLPRRSRRSSQCARLTEWARIVAELHSYAWPVARPEEPLILPVGPGPRPRERRQIMMVSDCVRWVFTAIAKNRSTRSMTGCAAESTSGSNRPEHLADRLWTDTSPVIGPTTLPEGCCRGHPPTDSP